MNIGSYIECPACKGEDEGCLRCDGTGLVCDECGESEAACDCEEDDEA